MELDFTDWARDSDPGPHHLHVQREPGKRKKGRVFLVPSWLSGPALMERVVSFRYPGSQLKLRVQLDSYGFELVGRWS